MKKGERLTDLEVLVVGVEQLISRDVLCALVADGASVTAAAREDRVLDRLQRDLGLYRTSVDVAHIDLFSASEMRLFADNLRAQRRMPHLIICCRPNGGRLTALAGPLLQPSLMLDAPPVVTRLRRAVAAMHVPSLSTLLTHGRLPTLFYPQASGRRVLVGGHVFGLRRWESAAVIPMRSPHEAVDQFPHAERRDVTPDPGARTARSVSRRQQG
jgi:hypothetical protein